MKPEAEAEAWSEALRLELEGLNLKFEYDQSSDEIILKYKVHNKIWKYILNMLY